VVQKGLNSTAHVGEREKSDSSLFSLLQSQLLRDKAARLINCLCSKNARFFMPPTGAARMQFASAAEFPPLIGFGTS
jgi:hypothetical protein